MSINRLAIKHNSRVLLSASKPSPFLVFLVYYVICYVLEYLVYSVSGYFTAMSEVMLQYQQENFDYLPVLPPPTIPSSLILLALNIMLLMLSVGLTIYFFGVASGKKVGFGSLFDGFAIFGKVLWLEILIYIFTLLWTMLFIIPGIIAAYRYRMALYIMLDHPEYSALECIRQSKAMMSGRKGELFVLDLSFLGWYLLTIVPFVTIFVTPYTGLTYANYYLALRDMPGEDSAAPTDAVI